MSKVLVLLSGGMDSAVVLGKVVNAYGAENVVALNMFYGQRHTREIECAKDIAKHYDVKLMEMDISSAFAGISSALLSHSSIEIEDDQDKNKVGSTYVPGRNSIFLSIAAGIADSIGAEFVYYGAHADDHSGYPDCTTAFVEKMTEALIEGTDNGVRIQAPFVKYHKSQIVKDGIAIGVPFEMTHSCYRGEYPACGTCPTCQLRLEAFKEAGQIDPINYKGDFDEEDSDSRD